MKAILLISLILSLFILNGFDQQANASTNQDNKVFKPDIVCYISVNADVNTNQIVISENEFKLFSYRYTVDCLNTECSNINRFLEKRKHDYSLITQDNDFNKEYSCINRFLEKRKLNYSLITPISNYTGLYQKKNINYNVSFIVHSNKHKGINKHKSHVANLT